MWRLSLCVVRANICEIFRTSNSNPSSFPPETEKGMLNVLGKGHFLHVGPFKGALRWTLLKGCKIHVYLVLYIRLWIVWYHWIFSLAHNDHTYMYVMPPCAPLPNQSLSPVPFSLPSSLFQTFVFLIHSSLHCLLSLTLFGQLFVVNFLPYLAFVYFSLSVLTSEMCLCFHSPVTTTSPHILCPNINIMNSV